ncbi:MAG: glycosyltransferase family 39 protein [Anaerolineae bacterium]|nr:glycosyltransferase family 39 protein [Anaerolineae bacterium]
MADLKTLVSKVSWLVWLAGGVMVAALLLRFFALDRFPPGVQHDEVFVANFAQTVLGGQYPIFFELNRGNEPLFMYLTAAMMRVFGENVWALRGTAAVCGFGALVLTYLLARDMFSKEFTGRGDRTSADLIALIAAAGITVSFWHLYESRIGLHTISTYLLAAATFYVFWTGWTRGNRVLLVLSGLLAGLSAYTYRSGIFVPAALLVFIFYTLLFHRKTWGGNVRLVPVILVAAALVYYPLFDFITTHPDTALARLGDLSGDMDALRQGNPLPLINNVVRVLGMFGVSGDPEWRYNVALRPIFDPLWATLFYVGIGVSFWRIKRAPYALALSWLFVMLLPSILSASDLSQHRATGAIGAAFLMPALALDEARMLVTERWGRSAHIGFGVVAVGLVLVAAVGGIEAYFVTWTNNPEVRLIQRADLATAARWLDEHRTDERALISAEFANDLDRGAFNLVARNRDSAQFLQGADTFVLPARTSAYIVNPRSGPVNESFKRQFLADPPLYTSKLQDGSIEVEIYKLTQEALQALRTTRELNTVAQTQDGQLLIRKAVLPQDAKSGGTLNAELWWQILAPSASDADGLAWIGALQDRLRYTWSEVASLGYTPSQWQTDDMVVTLLALPIPVDAPPQNYSLAVALGSNNGTLPLVKQGEMPTSPIQLGDVAIARGEAPETQPDLQVRYPNRERFGDIEFFGSDAVGEVEAGGSWRAILFWKADATLTEDFKVRLIALTQDGEEIARQESVLLEGVYPTSQWRAGEYVRSVHDFAVPEDAPRARAQIRLTVVGQDGKTVGRADGVPIAGIEIVGRTRVFEQPSPQTKRLARFGEAIELLGYDLPETTLRAGDPFEITLYWHARRATDKPYTVFVHLLDANGKVIGQKDAPPLNGDAPTDTWQKDEYIADVYTFTSAADALEGAAKVEVGLYDPATGARLEVDEDGAVGDHILVDGLTVE